MAMLVRRCTLFHPRAAGALLGVLVLATASAGSGGAAPDGERITIAVPDAAGPLTGFTSPQRAVTLASVRMGRIAHVAVDEGASVAAGAVIVQLDNTLQQRRVTMAAALAASTLAVELAEVRHAHAQAELARLRGLEGSNAVSEKERRDAEANCDATALALAQARFQQEQAQREADLQQAVLEELQIRAPFDGYVAARLKHAGDVVEEREGIVELVQLDPLVVAFDCPLPQAQQLEPGQQLTVQPAGAAQQRTGEVVFVSRVADAASQTCRVKLHVRNPDATWLAGMQVDVHLDTPAPGTAAAGADQKTNDYRDQPAGAAQRTAAGS
jgi:RND family efflux transporter MFP subunit